MHVSCKEGVLPGDNHHLVLVGGEVLLSDRVGNHGKGEDEKQEYCCKA
jgi:hypothetical protein